MRAHLLALVLLLAACSACDVVGGEGDPAPGPEPVTAPLTGTYSVTSRFEVPATVAAPGPLGDALRLVHELNVNPGGALLELAEAAGVPAVSELRLVLPSSVEEELEGWMSGYLVTATVDGRSPHDDLAALDARIRSVLLQWDLRSTLTLTPGGGGTHAPDALVFLAAGDPVVVPVDVTAPVTSGVNVAATVAWPAAGGPVVAISDHGMGIPFGRCALAALDVALERVYGAPGLDVLLARAIDCDALAADVAGRCLGVGPASVCVGHEPELREVCEGGRAEAAARLEARILELDYRAIHFAAGAASAASVAMDEGAGTATAAALTAGVWTATIDLGNEPEAATATFTAVR